MVEMFGPKGTFHVEPMGVPPAAVGKTGKPEPSMAFQVIVVPPDGLAVVKTVLSLDEVSKFVKQRDPMEQVLVFYGRPIEMSITPAKLHFDFADKHIEMPVEDSLLPSLWNTGPDCVQVIIDQEDSSVE